MRIQSAVCVQSLLAKISLAAGQCHEVQWPRQLPLAVDATSGAVGRIYWAATHEPGALTRQAGCLRFLLFSL